MNVKNEIEVLKEQVNVLINFVNKTKNTCQYIGEFYYEGNWTRFSKNDIVDTLEDNVKIKAMINTWPYLTQDVWIKKNQLFYYDDVYNSIRNKIVQNWDSKYGKQGEVK